jgi:hypothetical protein
MDAADKPEKSAVPFAAQKYRDPVENTSFFSDSWRPSGRQKRQSAVLSAVTSGLGLKKEAPRLRLGARALRGGAGALN